MFVRGLYFGLLLSLGFASSTFCLGHALAGTDAAVIDAVKAKSFVECGGVGRPGLADAEGGTWQGFEIEVCRAIAVAAIGPQARIAFHEYATDADANALRRGEDHIGFLTLAEVKARHLTDVVALGPVVYALPDVAMVPIDSPIQTTRGIAGKRVCFFIGSSAEDALSDYLARNHIDVIRSPFSEEGEMMDAYNVGRCQVVVGEAPTLAEARLHGGIHHLRSRMLPEAIGENRVYATIPTKDARWFALVALVIETLRDGTQINLDPRASSGVGLGLEAGWEQRVLQKIGSLRDIFARTLGDGTRLRVDPALRVSAQQ